MTVASDSSYRQLRILFLESIAFVISLDILGLLTGIIRIQADEVFFTAVFATIGFLVIALLLHSLSQCMKNRSYAFSARVYEIVGLYIETIGQFCAFVITTLVLSYIAARSPLPYTDKTLLWIDQLMQFDWLRYTSWVNEHPRVIAVFNYTYHSVMTEIGLIMILFSITRRYTALYKMFLAMLFSSTLCIIISAAVPSTGIIAYLHLPLQNYPNIDLTMGSFHFNDLNQLHSGDIYTINFANLKGLITFPSFHASSAVIVCWTWWNIRWLRWIALYWNILILCATPVIGGHYLIDVVVGIIIALWILYFLERRYKST